MHEKNIFIYVPSTHGSSYYFQASFTVIQLKKVYLKLVIFLFKKVNSKLCFYLKIIIFYHKNLAIVRFLWENTVYIINNVSGFQRLAYFIVEDFM